MKKTKRTPILFHLVVIFTTLGVTGNMLLAILSASESGVGEQIAEIVVAVISIVGLGLVVIGIPVACFVLSLKASRSKRGNIQKERQKKPAELQAAILNKRTAVKSSDDIIKISFDKREDNVANKLREQEHSSKQWWEEEYDNGEADVAKWMS